MAENKLFMREIAAFYEFMKVKTGLTDADQVKALLAFLPEEESNAFWGEFLSEKLRESEGSWCSHGSD